MGTSARQIPADFVSVAPTISMSKAREIWSAGYPTLHRWLSITGVSFAEGARSGRPVKPVPADFVEMAMKMGARPLGCHYGVSEGTALRWISECKLPGRGRVQSGPRGAQPHLRRPVPKDFVKTFHAIGHKLCLKRYQVSGDVLRRWKEETGLTVALREAQAQRKAEKSRLAAARVAARPVREVAGIGSVKPGKRGSGSKGNPAFKVPPIASTVAAEAAHFLRRLFPVFDRGVYGSQYAGTYSVGGRTMSEAEMIAYARSKGFRSIYDREAA